MVTSSILIYGKTTETKNRFVEQFTQINLGHRDTLQPSLVHNRDATHFREYNYWILDTSYQQSLSLYCPSVDAVLYFVESWDEHQITQDINALKAINPAMPLLFVGMSSKDDLPFMSIADYPALWLDNMADINRENILQLLNQMIDEKKRRDKEAVLFFPKIAWTPMAKAKDCTLAGSRLHQALEQLEEQLKSASPEAADAIAQSTEKLMLAWQRLEDRETIIATYLNECQIHLYGKHYRLAQAVFTVAIMATLTMAAAVVGFGIGFGLGLWSGPGAFFSGIIAGTAAAKVALASGVVGTVAGGLIAYGLFKSNPIAQAANDVTETMMMFPEYMDTDL
ncbi:hypothetical protein [Legionella erythra]|uniref:Rho GTPase (Miro-like) n=1 Tax=Legionella erythra TaxID=448 RepID=A0A0W0TFQ1_LEGER|nr:hypothetical protein [Legionella erythra]KTC94410.1 hypothetical protein Lery_2577 [Legionella erythra]